MRRIALAILLAACAPSALQAAPTPTSQLMVPPANADHFLIVSEAGKHGDEWRWALPDGSIAYRESILLRGLVFEQDEVVRIGKDGNPAKITIRGVTPSGDAAESFAIEAAGNGSNARWNSPVDHGDAHASPPAYYVSSGGTFLANDTLLPALLAAGSSGLNLLPSGRGTLEPSRTLVVTGPAGPKTIQLYFVKGINQSPQPYWLDDQHKLFGAYNGLALLPAGYEGNLAAMIQAQNDAIAELAPAIASRFLTDEARRPVLFHNVRIMTPMPSVSAKRRTSTSSMARSLRSARRRPALLRPVRGSSTARARLSCRASGTATCTCRTTSTRSAKSPSA